MAARPRTARVVAYEILEMGRLGHRVGAVVDALLIMVILLNAIAVALETVPHIQARHGTLLHNFEIASIALFSIEYLLRLWAIAEQAPMERGLAPWRMRWRYVRSPMAIIDLLAIAPFFLLGGVVDGRFLRLFRLLRLLKLLRYSPGMATLGRVLYDERRSLLAVLVIMVGLLATAATAIYLVEQTAQPKALGTIPDALWWALTTFTTVGYGDVVPVTSGGKIIGSFVMVIGFAFYAVPVGIIASGFANEIHRQQFVVRFGLVSKVPVFDNLGSDALSDLAGLLRSRIVDRGRVIIARGDPADCLYFLIQGRAEARLYESRHDVEPGEFFGEQALLGGQVWRQSVVARSTCHLLELEARDFHRMLALYPELADRVDQILEDRLASLVADGELSEAERTELMAARRAMFR